MNTVMILQVAVELSEELSDYQQWLLREISLICTIRQMAQPVWSVLSDNRNNQSDLYYLSGTVSLICTIYLAQSVWSVLSIRHNQSDLYYLSGTISLICTIYQAQSVWSVLSISTISLICTVTQGAQLRYPNGVSKLLTSFRLPSRAQAVSHSCHTWRHALALAGVKYLRVADLAKTQTGWNPRSVPCLVDTQFVWVCRY